jgi:hypothetical protein
VKSRRDRALCRIRCPGYLASYTFGTEVYILKNKIVMIPLWQYIPNLQKALPFKGCEAGAPYKTGELSAVHSTVSWLGNELPGHELNNSQRPELRPRRPIASRLRHPQTPVWGRIRRKRYPQTCGNVPRG